MIESRSTSRDTSVEPRDTSGALNLSVAIALMTQ